MSYKPAGAAQEVRLKTAGTGVGGRRRVSTDRKGTRVHASGRPPERIHEPRGGAREAARREGAGERRETSRRGGRMSNGRGLLARQGDMFGFGLLCFDGMSWAAHQPRMMNQ